MSPLRGRGVWVEGNLTMSRKEVDRVGVMQQVAERRILQQEAAARLGIRVRQVKRLLARLRGEGPQGLVSRRRGRRLNHAFPQDLRQEILALVRSQYAGFGPTLAAEKLARLLHPPGRRATHPHWTMKRVSISPSITPGPSKPNAPTGNPLPTILGVAIPPQHLPQNPLPDPPQGNISENRRPPHSPAARTPQDNAAPRNKGRPAGP